MPGKTGKNLSLFHKHIFRLNCSKVEGLKGVAKDFIREGLIGEVHTMKNKGERIFPYINTKSKVEQFP